ncbi:sigma-E factor negative regulatory protein [Atopomonas hussainii]|uniref:sigma-E factor negative regulatory protein n=1 Tax=Atopomonas hussainii TaxID=1429083 RepID=UPI0009001ACF|nr:RseA family anti-sigma factor [Atopomonas hussainii]
MSRDALHESLSALMDGEASELEVRRLLRDSADDGELRERWRHWHVARAAMHDELQAPKLDLASRVSAALADEPALVAQVPWYARMPGRVAVAASVTLAVLAGLQFAPLGEQAAPQLAQQEIPTLTIPGQALPGPAILAGYQPAETSADAQPVSAEVVQPTQNRWHEERMPLYLHQHLQQVSASQGNAQLPQARVANFEGR